jgi:hypothetical protein
VPAKTLTIKCNSIRTVAGANASADKGVLLNASCFVDREDTAPSQTYATLTVLRGGTSKEHRAILLVQGYIGPNNSLEWSGRFKLDPDDRVQLRAQSSVGDQVRAVFNLELE